MQKLGWGILATGGISRQFAGGLRASKTGELKAVGSRTDESAAKFTAEFGGKPYGSYDAVLADPDVQAVYIGLPHHMHSEWTIKAAQAGKAILCEKPFTLNKIEAERALAEVKKQGVFFMEAFMYRCHPQTLKVLDLIKSGVIGTPQMIDAEFGFSASREWNNFRLDGAVGGGALMDVGCYPVSFSRMVFGAEPERAEYSAVIGDKGYDEIGVGFLSFPGGRSLHFGTAVHANLRNMAVIHGTEGHIAIQDPWKASKGSKTLLYKPWKHEPFETLDLSDTNDMLYAHEADTVAEFLTQGESPRMSVADTLGQMDTLDRLRASAGLVFANEEKR